MVFTTEAMYVVTTAKKGELHTLMLSHTHYLLTMSFIYSQTPRTTERGQDPGRNSGNHERSRAEGKVI